MYLRARVRVCHLPSSHWCTGEMVIELVRARSRRVMNVVLEAREPGFDAVRAVHVFVYRCFYTRAISNPSASQAKRAMDGIRLVFVRRVRVRADGARVPFDIIVGVVAVRRTNFA